MSNNKHSKDIRKLSDGFSECFFNNITINVRKFKCKSSSCSQKIFTERLPFAAAYTRITNTVI
ncbi:hypothetical protein [Clostridium folliculivorans]|uniref:hypothetical protein n=1 Tax=Clostridium folliculivorans TaxID=2886038 RepID=UPI0021C2CE1F|nr:hypothetical protein [Clostridium folliculivorans]